VIKKIVLKHILQFVGYFGHIGKKFDSINLLAQCIMAVKNTSSNTTVAPPPLLLFFFYPAYFSRFTPGRPEND